MTSTTRNELKIDGRRLSYLDFGPATGRPLLALHGHLSEGASFTGLAAELGDEWRVIAPDQRGHGDSDRAADYSRQGYIDDLVALLAHLDLDSAVVLGHSLGGINAYQLAAQHPQLVAAVVNVEGPPALPDGPSGLSFVAGFPYTARTREELVAATGPVGPMIAPALRPTADGGWRLPFHPQDTIDSETLVHGDHWADWTGSTCPALFVHGTKSQVFTPELAHATVERRPNTTMAELDGDHFVHAQDPKGFASAVRDFLATL
ncbi:alpha/beta fold hydrolase [Streptomyces beijiangensis]|uniref:Alpha/beta hydrolase n=1 Tax=Streptomyces beijiangensis TaxID=163361 RepID=A0A939JIJ8_9ACTN|nr:alpha/beta hydrolase [Streptomyces beijiangensis]MBO0512644.1 alpha/beta hydrolase [Streptomyces beijiangensis]